MSRALCPHCRGKLTIRTIVRADGWADMRKAKSGATQTFDHKKAIELFQDGHSYASIAQSFNVSPERIRQIVAQWSRVEGGE